MKILNLDEAVTFKEAKQAYRRLAKRYHPDVAQDNGGPTNDGKMKEINRAFFILGPVLRKKKRSTPLKHQSDTAVKQPETPSSPRNDKKENKESAPSLSDILIRLVKKMVDRVKKQGQATAGNPGTSHGVKTNKERCPSSSPTNDFEQVFKTVYGRSLSKFKKKAHSGGRPRKQQQKSSYQGYDTYMTLQNKMKTARKRRHSEASVNRVEKIEPIRPVSPLHRD